MGFSTYGFRTQSESAIDNEVPLYLAGENKQAIARVAPGAADGGLDVYADELVQEHAGGKIARWGYGPADNPTWVMELTATGTTIAGYVDSGSFVHDVRAYGPWIGATLAGGVGPWQGPDNSATLQAAIDAAKGSGSNAVYLPRGVYGIGESIDVTNCYGGVTIIGDNPSNTRLVALPGLAGRVLFDFSGSASIKLRGFGIGDTANASVPACAILVANSSVSGPASNVHLYESLSISGSYAVAAVYVCAGVSSRMIDCQISNHRDAAVPALYFTANNAAGIASEHVTISATGGVGEWGLFGCELHDVGKASGASLGTPLICEQTYAINLFGGNVGGNGPELVRFVGANDNPGFWGVQMYAQDPSGTTPQATFRLAAASAVRGMAVRNCRLDAAVAVFAGGSGAILEGLGASANRIYGGATAMVAITPSGSLTDAEIDCGGLAVNVGAGFMTRGVLRNAGAVTVTGGDSSVRIDGSTVTLAAQTVSAPNGGVIAGDGSVATPAFRFAGDPDCGLYRMGTNNWGLAAGGGMIAQVTPSGLTVPNLLGFFKSVRVYHNASQSIATGTEVTLQFNSERWDPDGMHDAGVDAGRRLVAPVAGTYLIIGQIRWGLAGAAGNAISSLKVNGSTVIMEDRATLSTSNQVTQAFLSIYQLAASDYVTLVVAQFTGGAVNVENGFSATPEFMLQRIA